MKKFLWFFAGAALFQLGLIALAAAHVRADTPLFFPIFPAIWIAAVIRGVHSAGVLSLLAAVTFTSAVYALIACALWAIFAWLIRLGKRR